MMNTTSSIVELILFLLIAASGTALVCSRLKIPYTIALVFAGFGIDIFRPQIQEVLRTVGFAAGSNFEILTPEIIFTLFLPGLLFESSLHIDVDQLKQDLGRISVLAVIGVVVAAAATGYAVHWTIGLPLASALVFGVLISATDPISVVALFRELGVANRLTLLVEGESLFNDGTAVVLFKILVAAALTGVVDPVAGFGQFLLVVFGGLALGLAVGYAGSKLISRVDDARIEITLTTLIAYGSYLAAEHMHVSGVIATVSAGLVVGTLGVTSGMSARTRVALFGFWEYLAFVINSLVFLLIGVSVHISDLLASWMPIAIATAAVILGRLVTVYTLTPLTDRFAVPVPKAWNHVLFWGGLHGSVSIALALGLPTELPGRAEILNLTFGVVAFSIIVQGLTMQPLVNYLGLQPKTKPDYERLKAEKIRLAAARNELEKLREEHVISMPIFTELDETLAKQSEAVTAQVLEQQAQDSGLGNDERRIAQLRMALAEKSKLEKAIGEGLVSEPAAEALLDDADERISRLSH
ncbi:MAG: Na+/H+ antiporter [Bryobacter sp.]|nr:Na+/H+ antiporter [Bryobacter sp.]